MDKNVKNRHLLLAFLVAVSFLAAPAAKAQAADAAKEASTQLAGSNTAVSSEFEYILGPSDVLHIEALNHADFNVKTTIGPDNNIQLPYLGSFSAANLTVPALRDRILAELKRKGLFSNVSLQVEIVQYSSRFVTVLGGVTTPGLVPVDRAYHLSEILARAGGVREGSSNYVILSSKGGKGRKIAVEDIATGNEVNDPWVSPGDKVFVPAEIFYIKGQVRAPGAYSLPLKMTLAMALARGGGLTDAGSVHSIKVTRNNVVTDVDDLNFKIEPNDVVDVGTSWF